ncbi:MAG: ATP-binding protein [Desulfomonilaceae bacterium]
MLGIRQKLSLGFGGLLLVILIIGIESVTQLTDLGGSIEIILRENYQSVLACRGMQNALASMNSGILFTFMGYEHEGVDLIRENEAAFQKALDLEFENISLAGEGDKAKRVEKLFSEYKQAINSAMQPGVSLESRRGVYFTHILPLSDKIQSASEEILVMNQQNMHDADKRARKKAENARRLMLMLLLFGVTLAVVFMILIGKWILRPIATLTASALEIKSGNLDLVVSPGSKDEIGTLAQTFNDMTVALREYRRTRRAQLINLKRATEQAFKVLPEAVVIVNAEGVIEIASGSATKLFDIWPNQNVRELHLHGVVDLYEEALHSARTSEAQNGQALVQKFINGKEHYFRPKAIPILDNYRQTSGVVISLPDVTLEREQNEMKRGVVSTVSHQLKTPLTSIRMSLHLLLEEKVGALSEKQADLVVAAKEESDRLHLILEQLLNISRIESGKTAMDLRAVRAHELIIEAVEPFRSSARDKGITLEIQLPDDLPEVQADPVMIGQVFANLLSNALKYTDPGGSVSISAEPSDDFVRFSVADTGKGIPPQYLKKILEHFFRVPGQTTESGLGLGLSIVQEIVEAHGGNVTVESRESEGSIFEFSLKRSDSVANQEVNHD